MQHLGLGQVPLAKGKKLWLQNLHIFIELHTVSVEVKVSRRLVSLEWS